MTSRFLSRGILLISLCFLFAAPPLHIASAVARSSASSEFRSHVDKATKLFEAGDYEEAITEMKAAYAIRQLPKLLLNIGSAYRKLGRSKDALGFYEFYLRVEPNPKPEIKSELEAYITQSKAMMEAAEKMKSSQDKPGTDGKTGGETPPGSGTGAARTNKEPLPAGVRLDAQNGTAGTTSDQSTQKKPVYKKWWFWTIIGGVAVGAAVTAGVVLGTRPKEPDGIEIRDNRF